MAQNKEKMIFDTHAHYDDRAFNDDRDSLLSSLFNDGIESVVNVASGMDSCITSIELSKRYENIYAAVGVHPAEIDELTDCDMKLIEEYCDNPKVVAIGEIGLDYHYPDIDIAAQKDFFVKQLSIARKKNMPIIIHSRDAAADTMDIIKAEKAYEMGGVIHCYSYSYEMAKDYVNMGFYIGIGGVVTFKNSRKLQECVEKLPIETLVLETDCPYLAPDPFRGKRNNSLFLPYVVEKISEIKGMDKGEVIDITTCNAKKLYRLD